MMHNYRINIQLPEIDYHTNFSDCRKYMPVVLDIMSCLRANGCHAWWFFEPHIEITWVVPDGEVGIIPSDLFGILGRHGFKPDQWEVMTPADGQFADWFGLTPEERESGIHRYEAISMVAEAFYHFSEVIKNGCGIERHYMRACHVLANMLGINYEEESDALYKRSMFARFAWSSGDQAKAVAFYEAMFHEKYMGRDDD